MQFEKIMFYTILLEGIRKLSAGDVWSSDPYGIGLNMQGCIRQRLGEY